jgi:hypothetical protein
VAAKRRSTGLPTHHNSYTGRPQKQSSLTEESLSVIEKRSHTHNAYRDGTARGEGNGRTVGDWVNSTTASNSRSAAAAAAAAQPPPSADDIGIMADAASSGNTHQLRQKLTRLIAEECTAKITNHAIQNLQAICTTLCEGPQDVLAAIGVLEDELANLKAIHRFQQMLRIWYLLDALLKHFRKQSQSAPGKMKLLHTMFERLPRLVEKYVPFQIKAQDPDLLDKYLTMFTTWHSFAPQSLILLIANLEQEY